MVCNISTIYISEIDFKTLLCKFYLLSCNIVKLAREIKPSTYYQVTCKLSSQSSVNYTFLVCKLHVSHVITIKCHTLFQNLMFYCWCKFHKCSKSKAWDISPSYFLLFSILLWNNKAKIKFCLVFTTLSPVKIWFSKKCSKEWCITTRYL